MRVLPWLLEREYRQHRSLDRLELPETFDQWHESERRRAQVLSRFDRQRIVKMVIHPGELETWALMTGRPVTSEARIAFAQMLWNEAEAHHLGRRAMQPKRSSDTA